MTTYVYGTHDQKWGYIRPQDFLPFVRRYGRKQFNRFLRSGHPEHHTKRVWHRIGRKYTRQGLVHIDDFGWVSAGFAEHWKKARSNAD